MDGGVVFVGEGAAVEVEGGVFDSNLAGNGGGAFAAEEYGDINVRDGERRDRWTEKSRYGHVLS